MPDELRTIFQAVRRRLRSSLWWGGVCALLSSCVLILLITALLDWFVIGNSLSGRVLLSFVAVIGFLWIINRELWNPLSHPLSDRWLAQRIEQKLPELNGQLTSTVEFSLATKNDRFGSVALQERAVDSAIRKVLTLDLLAVIDPRPVRIRTRIATLAACLGSVILLLFPAHAWTAMQRLCLPWQSIEWPREVILQLQTVENQPLDLREYRNKLFPRGTTLELRVVNLQGELPTDLELIVSQPEGEDRHEAVPHLSDKSETAEYGQILIPLRESMKFRLRGGDDDHLPWISIDVIPPPVLSDLKLTVVNPEYTKKESVLIPSGTTLVQSLVGSKLMLSGTANVPLKAAQLVTLDHQTIPLAIDPGTAQFAGELILSNAGNRFYRLELTDEFDISNSSAARLEVVGVEDEIPQVRMIAPESDQYLTPEANLLVKIEAFDDVALTGLTLAILPQSESTNRSVWKQEILTDSTDRQESEISLNLHDLGYRAGDVLKLQLVGRDHLSLEGEHQGVDERLLTLVSQAEKHRELAGRLEEIVGQIERSAERENVLRESWKELIERREQDSLAGLLTDQKRIERNLIDPESSLRSELNRLIAETTLNQIDQPQFLKRLSDLDREFQQLEDADFPRLNQLLGRFQSLPFPTADESLSELPDLETILDPTLFEHWRLEHPFQDQAHLMAKLVEFQQLEIEIRLKDMAGSLSAWKQQQSLQESLSELMESQQAIETETRHLNSRLLGQSTRELRDDDRQRLQELSAAQLRNQSRLREFQEALQRESEKTTAQPKIGDLAETVSQSNTDAMMSENQRAIRENHLNQAEERNRSLIREFQEWDDQLNNRPVTNAELKLQRLDEQSRQLVELIEAQQHLGDEIRTRQTSPQSLADQQERQEVLIQKASRISRMLERLQLPKSAEAVASAGQSMETISSHLGRNLPAIESSLIAEQKLIEAQKVIDHERQQLQTDHQLELLTQLLPQVVVWSRQQQTLNYQADQLRTEVSDEGRWNRTLLRSLNEVRDGQQQIIAELGELQDSIGELPAVMLATERLLANMRQSHSQLSSRNLETAAVTTMPRSVTQLEILENVLRRMLQKNLSNNSEDGATDHPESEEGQNTLYVELLLLRAVQEQIQAESRELSQREFKQGSSPDTEAEWNRLEVEQSELLLLLKKILTEQQEPSTTEEVI